jgi:hypothetical protein
VSHGGWAKWRQGGGRPALDPRGVARKVQQNWGELQAPGGILEAGEQGMVTQAGGLLNEVMLCPSAAGCSRTHSAVTLGDWSDPLDPDAETQMVYRQLLLGRDQLRWANPLVCFL